LTTDLPIQKFLRSGGTLEQLTAKYAVKAKRHPTFNSLVHLKYNQIESPFAEPVVQNCRGLILDESNDWAIVCRSFDKFFNYGEILAAAIDWSTARVEEKLDGSLCNLYWYGDQWNVSTTGTPDAGGFTMNSQLQGSQTYEELFWQTFNGAGHDETLLQRGLTYSFELMTPFNKVVVPHRVSKVALLAVRDTLTDVQLDAKKWGAYLKIPTTTTLPLQNWEDCVAAAKKIDPTQSEGYVVVDAQWNRVKMKAPAYVALAHMRDSAASPKRVLEVIRTGESTEFLAYFPEWKPTFDAVRDAYNKFADQIDADYASSKNIGVQKDFAFEAMKTAWPDALFQLRRGRYTNARDYLKGVRIKQLMEKLSVEDKEIE
jgi:hypothetical protein